MRKAIVIPSYKAEKTLPDVLARIPKEFWEQEGMVVIVNDCSPDQTSEVAHKLAKDYPDVKVVDHQHNQGYGGAQKTGLQTALADGAQAFAVVHADGQYPPELVLELMAPILEGKAHIVQGSRFVGGGALKGGMPLIRYIPNVALTALENIAFGTRMAEFHSGYMIYSEELLTRVPFELLQDNFNFDAEMIIMAHLLGLRCAELPIPTRYDDEVSSLDPIPYGLNVLRMILRFMSGHYHRLFDERQLPGSSHAFPAKNIIKAGALVILASALALYLLQRLRQSSADGEE